MDSQDLSPFSSSSSQIYLMGFLIANVVGMTHHNGTIRHREAVRLLREPYNAHDSNAIQVINKRYLQVGYIERKVAAVLSPLIDSKTIVVEGIVPNPRQNGTRFKLPCQVHIFAEIEDFPDVKDAILQEGLEFISCTDPSFALSESMAVKETMAPKVYRSVDKSFEVANEMLVENDHGFEAIDPPRRVIKSELLEHQREGLGWLVSRENSEELPPFWVEENGEFVNFLTDYKTVAKPKPLNGGIFADDMGLGKTLTLLSLIALDQEPRDNAEIGDEGSYMKKDKKRIVSVNKDTAVQNKSSHFKVPLKRKDRCSESEGWKTKATLVVCTPSVLSTWVTQLEEHTVRGSLRIHLYYGDKRAKKPEELMNRDLVLTTYSTLSSEHPSRDTPVKKLEWWRIILDEAHTIQNHNSQQSQAVVELKARRRWAVTGTPIHNGSFDLFSIMQFLHFEPFSISSSWKNFVQHSLNQGQERGLQRLQVLMAAISLRRTKENGLVWLPPKTIETCYVELSSEEREVYERVQEESKRMVKSFIENDNVVHHYSSILSMILRLRQICTDMALCPSDLSSIILSYNIEDVSNNPELQKKLAAVLLDGEDIDCPICYTPRTDSVITSCGHIFCRACILKSLNLSNESSCPLCRRRLSETDDLFSAPLESSTRPSSSSSTDTRLSSKVSTLIKLLTDSRNENPDIKSVVFSQFQNLLLLLEEPLRAAGFKTLRLDGTMNANQRAQVIQQFRITGRGGPMILLASLRASCEGINLTAASRVYLMEPWLNPAVEEQAVDRVHRIGQREAVKIVRLIAQDSIEEKILMLQEKKKELSREAFGRKTQEVGTGMGIHDLSFLMSL